MLKRLSVSVIFLAFIVPAFAQNSPLPGATEKSKRKFDRLSQESLVSPYRENLSEDEKTAGLSLFWSSVRYNFANFDLVPELNWDSLYTAYLPKVRKTETTLEYYKVMMELCARLKDGHTNVYPPKELMEDVYSRPPLRTALIEDKILITDVWSASLTNDGIKPGLEVTAINKIPVKKYAEERVMPYQSASTLQDLQVRSYNYLLLGGAKDENIELRLEDGSGNTFEKIIRRSGYSDITGIPASLEFKRLAGNTGLLALNSFSDESVPAMFDSVFQEIQRTDALIIDLRRNGGGADGTAFYILSCLTDRSFKVSPWRSPQYVASLKVWGKNKDWYMGEEEDRKPEGEKLYSKPVILLVGPRTFSAAEDFTVAFDYMKRGTIVGEMTGGSTGQPIFYSLPGGGSFRICTKHDTYPDGKEFVGIGIKPSVIVHPTVKDFRQGRDAVLEAALKILKEENGLPGKN